MSYRSHCMRIKWHKRFLNGQHYIKNNLFGRPVILRIIENIQKLNDKIEKDRRWSVWMTADRANINREINKNFKSEFVNEGSLCKNGTNNLSCEKIETRFDVCSDIMEWLTNDFKVVKRHYVWRRFVFSVRPWDNVII